MLEVKKKRTSQKERCVLVAIVNKQQDEVKAVEYLEELRFLADTAGADTIQMFTQKLAQPNPKTFLGRGKMEDILGFIKAEDIDMVVFDDELTPSTSILFLYSVMATDGNLCRICGLKKIS